MQAVSSVQAEWDGRLSRRMQPTGPAIGGGREEDLQVATKIAINGFGRIGRMFFRAALHQKDLQVVAVNDITDAPTLAHLLKYDSVHGTLPQVVKAEGDQIMLDGYAFRVLAERDPSKLPWKQLGVQVVIESTGLFTARDKAAMHLNAGARKVIISAPAEGADITLCLGVNQGAYESMRLSGTWPFGDLGAESPATPNPK